MATLSAQALVDATGAAPTFGAATTSDTAPYGNGHNTIAVYKNGDTSSHTVTITVPGVNSYGRANPAATYTIAAGAQAWIPLRQAFDNGITPGMCTLTLDASTSMTVAVVVVQ